MQLLGLDLLVVYGWLLTKEKQDIVMAWRSELDASSGVAAASTGASSAAASSSLAAPCKGKASQLKLKTTK